MVTHEEHLTMEIKETIHHVLNIAMVLVSCAVLWVEEEGLYLALGVEILREVVDVSVVGAEEVILHILRIIAESIAEEVRADIWLGEAVTSLLLCHTLCKTFGTWA